MQLGSKEGEAGGRHRRSQQGLGGGFNVRVTQGWRADKKSHGHLRLKCSTQWSTELADETRGEKQTSLCHQRDLMMAHHLQQHLQKAAWLPAPQKAAPAGQRLRDPTPKPPQLSAPIPQHCLSRGTGGPSDPSTVRTAFLTPKPVL